MHWSICTAMALSLAIWRVASAQVSGDPTRGQAAFVQCKACHSLEVGKNGVGPSLHGLFGRQSGTAPNYNYSEAMKNAGVVWDDDTLFKYLADPKAFVPGDKMTFPGVKDEQKRRDVIAYLKQATQ